MADPKPFDLAAIEAALVPPPRGVGAWAQALCALDPQVGLRAAIAAARLVEPIWDEQGPRGAAFADSVTAAQAYLDHPCAACAAKARQAAARSGKSMQGASEGAKNAHRTALFAAEAAGRLSDKPLEASTYVEGALLRAAALTSALRLTGTVQTEVLGWILSDAGPIATYTEAQLNASSVRSVEATAQVHMEILYEQAQARATLSNAVSTLTGAGLQEALRSIGALNREAAVRAAISAGSEALPLFIRELPKGKKAQNALFAAIDALREPDQARVLAALTRGRRALKSGGESTGSSAHLAAQVAGWAAHAAHHHVAAGGSNPAASVDMALVRALKILNADRLAAKIREHLESWLDGDDPLNLLRSRLLPTGQQCTFFHECGSRHSRIDGLCDDHRLRVDNLGLLWGDRTEGPSELPPPPTPPLERSSTSTSYRSPNPAPERADWKIGHKVRVRPSMEVTCLGEGVVVDLEFVRGTETVKAALVRFEDGPADGVWYSVNTLLPHEDLFGSKLN